MSVEDTQEEPSREAAGEGASPAPRSANRRQRRVLPSGCQVEGCSEELTLPYHKKYHICEGHFKAPCVLVDGAERRFCQKCGRFQSIAEFTNEKRTCIVALETHNARRRKRHSEQQAAARRSAPAEGPRKRPAAPRPVHAQPPAAQQLDESLLSQWQWQGMQQQQQQQQEHALMHDTGVVSLAALAAPSGAPIPPPASSSLPLRPHAPLAHAPRPGSSNRWERRLQEGLPMHGAVPPLPDAVAHPPVVPGAVLQPLLQLASLEGLVELLQALPADITAAEIGQVASLLAAAMEAQQPQLSQQGWAPPPPPAAAQQQGWAAPAPQQAQQAPPELPPPQVAEQKPTPASELAAVVAALASAIEAQCAGAAAPALGGAASAAPPNAQQGQHQVQSQSHDLLALASALGLHLDGIAADQSSTLAQPSPPQPAQQPDAQQPQAALQAQPELDAVACSKGNAASN